MASAYYLPPGERLRNANMITADADISGDYLQNTMISRASSISAAPRPPSMMRFDIHVNFTSFPSLSAAHISSSPDAPGLYIHFPPAFRLYGYLRDAAVSYHGSFQSRAAIGAAVYGPMRLSTPSRCMPRRCRMASAAPIVAPRRCAACRRRRLMLQVVADSCSFMPTEPRYEMAE